MADITFGQKSILVPSKENYIAGVEDDAIDSAVKRFSSGRFLNPLDQISVNTIDDFPAPTDTGDGNGIAIHLETHTAYILGDHISTSYSIIAPADYGYAAILSQASELGIGLSYTGTGTAFTDSNKKLGYFTISGLSISSINGTLFDFECDDPNVECYFSCKDAWAYDMERIGYIRANVTAEMFWMSFFTFNYGLIIIDATYFSFTLSWIGGNDVTGCNFFEIQGNNGEFGFTQANFYPASNETIFKVNLSAIVNAAIIANSAVEGLGAIFDPSGINQTDPYWRASGNRGIPDSKIFINQYVKIAEASAPITTFTALNEPVLINNTFNYGTQERYSGATDGKITYTGLEVHNGFLNYSITLVCLAGLNRKFQLLPSIENPITMLITSIADAGGGEIDIVTNNAHGLVIDNRFMLFNMTVGGYDEPYTVNSLPNSTTIRVTATFTSTATGEWRKILNVEGKGIELDANEPAPTTIFSSLENLQTGDVYVMLVESLTDSGAELKFFDIKAIIL